MKRESRIWLIVLLVAAAWLLYRAATGSMALEYVHSLPTGIAPASPDDAFAGAAKFSLSRTIGIWTAALLTLAIFSFLYRDNPFYRFAESVVVGVSAGYWMVVAIWTVLVPNLFGKLVPAWIQSWAMPGLSPLHDEHWYVNFVPLVLGIMLLWRLSPKGNWIARWPLAFIIGTTAGLKLVHFLQADFLSQIHAGIEPVIVTDSADVWTNVWASVRSGMVFLGTLAVLVYFFFSIEHKGLVGKVSRGGIWVLMVTFGAAFGYTVMGRIALLAIRFEYLFGEWLWLIDPANQRLTS